MQRIVLDTNIRVSAAEFGGKPLEVVSVCKRPDFVSLISDPLLQELYRTLNVRFRWSQALAEAEVSRALAASIHVEPNLCLTACRDPDDDRVLECAVTGRATLIITGDRDLLSMRSFHGIRIITPGDFLDGFVPYNPIP